MIQVALAPELTQLHVIALEIEQVMVEESSARLRLWADQLVAATLSNSGLLESEQLRSAVRKLLRYGKFKASGRSKPAQEYLLRCAQEEGALPRINGPVDVLNACSLAGGLPISLLSLRKCSRHFLIRRGLPDEAFVFNASGQCLDVEDLIVTCDATYTPARPVGSPIKDSMVGKIESIDSELVAIIYAPNDAPGQTAAAQTARLLAENLQALCAARIGSQVELSG